MNQLPLFVFGTLRRGQENHRHLEGRYDRVVSATLHNFRRGVTGHGFPAAMSSKGSKINGELFFLPPAVYDEVIRDTDILEDIPPGKLVGDYYQRTVVTVETADGEVSAWAYIDPGTTGS